MRSVYDKNYINGTWVSVSSDRGFSELNNPATGEVSGKAIRSNEADVDQAVQAAKAAFPAWSKTTVEQRKAVLLKLKDAIIEREVPFLVAVTLDLGTPVSVAREIHLEYAFPALDAFVDGLDEIQFEERDGTSLILREPIGVAALICPWNGPATMFVVKVCAALAAGCTIVYKPAEMSTHSCMVLAEAIASIGLPDGVFNMVLGKGSVVGEAMSCHPDVDFVSFTGSNPVGERVAKNAAKNITKVGLELGGKSAFVVLPGADVMKTAQDAIMSVMPNSGQICASGTRTLVPRAMKDEFVAVMKAVLDQMPVGDPLAPASVIGPVISEHQWSTVQNYIQSGIDDGATVVTGGTGKPEGLEAGSFVKPTIFANATNDMKVAREEVFGPVASVIAYDSVEEAIEIANDSPYGLSGYVYGPNLDEAVAVARQIRSGLFRVNSLDADLGNPWGGYKASGLGRECGRWGIEEMLEIKAINNAFAA